MWVPYNLGSSPVMHNAPYAGALWPFSRCPVEAGARGTDENITLLVVL